MIFPCDRCGLCCKHLELILDLKYLDKGNGRCIHLLDNNLCGVYEERPDLCNVSKMYDLQFCSYMSEEEYIQSNIEGCRSIKEKYIGL